MIKSVTKINTNNVISSDLVHMGILGNVGCFMQKGLFSGTDTHSRDVDPVSIMVQFWLRPGAERICDHV